MTTSHASEHRATSPVDAVERWRGLRVAVIGDVLLDVWLEGTAQRLCREAPVPVIRVTRRDDVPGGAANVARNIMSLGAVAQLISVTGDDEAGRLLRRALEADGVGCGDLLASGSRATAALHRVVADTHLIVRFDDGSTEPVDAPTEAALVDALNRVVPTADVVLISDYGRGVLTDAVVAGLRELLGSRRPLVVVDSKHPARFRDLRPTAVKPNWSETAELLGLGQFDGIQERADGLAAQGEQLLDLTGARVVAATLDTEGAVVFERGRPPHRTYARPRGHANAAGAGDTFVATFALALASGAATPAAAELASAAAEVVVARERTVACSDHQLRAQFGIGGKLVGTADLAACGAGLRKDGKRIVFTNGCFDILHRGHITYLNRAKTLGDVLIVGINDDGSVRRLKGAGRPINTVDDRAEVLAALSCVDKIVIFSGDTPADEILALRPDVYTKGGDYTIDTLPEAPLVHALGGQVSIVPYMTDRSTTGLVERIRHRSPEVTAS